MLVQNIKWYTKKEEKQGMKEVDTLEKKVHTNLPQLRKVAIARRRTRFVMLVALFISCFSLSVFIGFIGPFMLFK